MHTGSRYWLVGASEGLGRALAEKLSARGIKLALSARSDARLQELVASLPNDAKSYVLDVRDREAVKRIASEVGDIDGVIFAAGVYWPMRAQDWDVEQVEAMCDVNFTGAARVLGAVVPEMIRRNHGHVVLIGSLSGFCGLPGAIGYGASKAGLMHMAENLGIELHRTNVKVQVVNPGFINTRLTEKNDFRMPFLISADAAADHVIAAMQSNRFQSNFPMVFSWLFRAARFLPAAVYFRLFG
jgi:short-subunit dehydrogenase